MHILNFTYQDKEYTGYIASSTIKEPYFHWLFLADTSLTELIGDDCIAFKQLDDGSLEHFNRISIHHIELVKIAELKIKDYLNQSRS